MIIGQYISKLTDKDRIAVPKKFRSELGNKLIISRWYENCLILVSEESWNKLLSRLGNQDGLIITPRREIDRFILGLSFQVDLDSQGRFVLPESLKKFSGITDDAIFVGLGDRIEIWPLTKWQELEEDVEVRAAKAIDKLSKL